MTFQPRQIPSDYNPRDIIKECFKKDLPIKGGWGYGRDDCVVIDKNDSTVSKGAPFNGISIEYVFVEKRLYIELIVARPEEDRYSDIQWKLQRQGLQENEGRKFDRLIFDVTAFRDNDWEMFKAEYESGLGSPTFDIAAHEKKREELQIEFTCEFWFDITSFFSQI